MAQVVLLFVGLLLVSLNELLLSIIVLLEPLVFLLHFLVVLAFFPLSFSLPLSLLGLLHVAHFLVEPLVLSLLLEVDGIKIHNLILELPKRVFDLILIFLVFLDLRIDVSLLLNKTVVTSSIYFIYS